MEVGLEMDGYVYLHAYLHAARRRGYGIVRAVGAYPLGLATEIAHGNAMAICVRGIRQGAVELARVG